MKIFACAIALTLSIGTSAQAGPTRITLPATSAPNILTNPPPTAPAPITIPVPAPRQSAPPPAATTPTSVSEIVTMARAWKGTPYRYAGNSRTGIDCSHFVFAIYSQAVPGFGYRMAREYLQDNRFSVVATPQAGDIIVFPSHRGSTDHVGIITDAQSQLFIGSQTSTGVAETSYGPNTYYWGKRPYRILRMR